MFFSREGSGQSGIQGQEWTIKSNLLIVRCTYRQMKWLNKLDDIALVEQKVSSSKPLEKVFPCEAYNCWLVNLPLFFKLEWIPQFLDIKRKDLIKFILESKVKRHGFYFRFFNDSRWFLKIDSQFFSCTFLICNMRMMDAATDSFVFTVPWTSWRTISGMVWVEAREGERHGLASRGCGDDCVWRTWTSPPTSV